MPATAIRGRQKTSDKTSAELQRSIQFLSDIPSVTSVVLGGFEIHRHHLRPGTLRVMQEQNNGLVLKGYDHDGTRRLHVYCPPMQRIAISQRIEAFNKEGVREWRDKLTAKRDEQEERPTRSPFNAPRLELPTAPPPTTPPTPKADALVTVTQAAAILGCSDSAIYLLREAGKLTHTNTTLNVGRARARTFYRADVEALIGTIKGRRKPAAPAPEPTPLKAADVPPAAAPAPEPPAPAGDSLEAVLARAVASALNPLVEEVRGMRSELRANSAELGAVRELLPALIGIPPVALAKKEKVTHARH